MYSSTPGIEPGLGQPEQDAVDVEAPLAPHEAGQRGDDAPGDQDAGDPAPRPHLVEDQVAGDFADEVAQEEQSGAETEHRVGEPEILDHGRRGHADVRPVQVGAEITEHEQRHQPPGHPLDGFPFDRLDCVQFECCAGGAGRGRLAPPAGGRGVIHGTVFLTITAPLPSTARDSCNPTPVPPARL